MMRAFLLILYLIEGMLAQNEVSFQFASYTSTSALAQSTPSGPLLTENTLGNNTSLNVGGMQDVSQISCTPGVLIGTFDFIVPNATSIFVSGINVNITWGYSQYVTIMPNEIEIKYASLSNSKSNSWSTIATINGSLTYYVWTIPQGSATDQFVVRLVPDRKETAYNVGYIGKAHCFADGMVTPSSSNPFKIVTNIPLITSPDSLGPRSRGHHHFFQSLVILILILIL